MEEKLRSPKFCAALVLSFYVLVLIFFWDFSRAVHRVEAVEPQCRAADMTDELTLRLGVAADAAAALEILREGEPIAAHCRREAFREQLASDSRFLVAIGLLIASFFLFVGSLRHSRPGFYILLAAGIVVGVAFGVSDIRENSQLKALIAAASGPGSADSIFIAFHKFNEAKLALLAIAGAALGLLWKSRSPQKFLRWSIWPLRLVCLASAMVIAIIIFGAEPSVELARCGYGLVAAWWSLGALHCVAVAVAPEPHPDRNRRGI